MNTVNVQGDYPFAEEQSSCSRWAYLADYVESHPKAGFLQGVGGCGIQRRD